MLILELVVECSKQKRKVLVFVAYRLERASEPNGARLLGTCEELALDYLLGKYVKRVHRFWQ